MRSFSRRLATSTLRLCRSSRFRLALLAAAVACAPPDDHYDPNRDAAVLETVASAWSEGAEGGLVLTLCEDLDEAQAEADAIADGSGCQVAHVVRGGGRGRAESVDHQGIGCGGCGLTARGFVLGTISGGGLVAPAASHGFLTLTGEGDDAYDLPWNLTVLCDDPATPCAAEGEIGRDGLLHVTLRRGPVNDPAAVYTEHVLTRGDAAACP